MKDVADACHEAGLQADRLLLAARLAPSRLPHGRTMRRYIEYLHGQIRELLTNYGRIDGLWFDLAASPRTGTAENLFKMARTLQPWLIINNRCGLPGDFDTPEQHVGPFQFDRPWESCMTLGTQWSWKPDDDTQVVQGVHATMLVTCAVGRRQPGAEHQPHARRPDRAAPGRALPARSAGG